MTLKRAIEVLKIHNQWRRGGLDHYLKPKEIGEAIDFAIKKLTTK